MQYTGHLISAVMLALLFAGQAHAQSSEKNAIIVQHPWARATPGGAKTAAVYVTLINNGSVGDRLLSATTAIAEHVQFHSVSEENGVSRMRDMRAVEIAAGATVTFRPGGMHIMLVGLNHPLREGQTLPMTFNFERGGRVDVMASVAKVGAMHHNDMDPMRHGSDHSMKK